MRLCFRAIAILNRGNWRGQPEARACGLVRMNGVVIRQSDLTTRESEVVNGCDDTLPSAQRRDSDLVLKIAEVQLCEDITSDLLFYRMGMISDSCGRG